MQMASCYYRTCVRYHTPLRFICAVFLKINRFSNHTKPPSTASEPLCNFTYKSRKRNKDGTIVIVNCGRLATNCKLHRNAHERLTASQPQKPLVTGTRTSSALIILSDTHLTANNTVLRTRKQIYQDFSPAMKYDFCDYNLMVICD